MAGRTTPTGTVEPGRIGHRASPPAARAATAAVLCAALVTVSAACSSGPTRSAAAFCSHYQADKAHYLAKYNAEAASINAAGQSNPLAGLLGTVGMTAQMMGSVDDMFTDLAKVAPDDIQTQVEQVRDSIKKQEDLVNHENPLSGSSLLGGLLGSVMTSLEASDAWQQVGAYIQNSCHTT